jgi:glycosyl-4,4'-diaponeurosporenoate acyltransferase
VILRLPDVGAVVLSSVVWALSSVVVGWVATRWPLERLARPGPLTRLREWERDGAWWNRHLRVRRWRDVIPEAGSLMGGYSKRHLRSRRSEDLNRFRLETVRAERVHWLLLASSPLHLIWCRPAVAVGMLAFGVLSNVPFIIVQRANRGRLDRLLHRRARLAPRRGGA